MLQKHKAHLHKPQLIVKHDPSVQNKERFTVHLLTRQQEARIRNWSTVDVGSLCEVNAWIKDPFCEFW